MTGVDDAAGAILRAFPDASSFPAYGRVTSISVQRSNNQTGPITEAICTVRVLGQEFFGVKGCGTFLAEINAAGTDRFEGREVVVISVWGRLMVLTTSGG